MKILHVSLGLPPLRTGGMTRYSVELMQSQCQHGHEVSLLYPGRFLPGRTRVNGGSWQEVSTYEVVNPLPIPLTYGVAEPGAFMAPCDTPEAYVELLSSLVPDVVHVHCFQGIHAEFFDAAENLGIPCVFTTHDYYPACPRTTLINRDGESCEGPMPERCAVCCRGVGMTAKKSRVMQSRLYAATKGSAFMRTLIKRIKGEMAVSQPIKAVEPASPGEVERFSALLGYNVRILSKMSLILANSPMTERIYRGFFPQARYVLVPGTHSGLNRPTRPARTRKKDEPAKIAYFGGMKPYKGYGTLMKACTLLHEKGFGFSLDLYGDDYVIPAGVSEASSMGMVPPEEVRSILRAHDVVVVPSIYHETCGFVVLEALSEGIRVVCSDAVGAASLVQPDYVFKAGDAPDLAHTLERSLLSTGEPVFIPADYPIKLDDQVSLLDEAYEMAIGR